MSKRAAPLFRLLCSALLLAYLAATVDFRPLAEVMPRFRLWPYLVGLAIMLGYVALQSLLLQSLLKARGVSVSWSQMLRYNFISSFFGVVLPSGSGADVVMVVSLCRTSADRAAVLATVVFARLAGLMAMVFVAFLASFTAACPVPALRPVTAAILAGVAVCFLLFRTGMAQRVQARLLSVCGANRIASFTGRVLDAFAGLGGSARLLLALAPVLLLLAAGRGLMDCQMARALGVELPLSNFFIFSTVVSLATMLPVSVAGLGVREVTFAGLFALVGVNQAVAVAISLLSFSLSLWVCLIGAILYGRGGWRR